MYLPLQSSCDKCSITLTNLTSVEWGCLSEIITRPHDVFFLHLSWELVGLMVQVTMKKCLASDFQQDLMEKVVKKITQKCKVLGHCKVSNNLDAMNAFYIRFW